jgi:uncharacterized protein YqjF (DUF2071 family)
MVQSWHDLLFAHWPVPAEALRPKLPAALTLDTFEGRAFVGVVPFRMSGVRLRWLPPLPGASAFPELNVRTYVIHEERPGVYFFSLDAASGLAVAVARTWFHLPYFRARMSCAAQDGGIRYASARTHRGAPAAALRARYRPLGDAAPAAPGTLAQWLTERYCLYSVDGRGRAWRGEIHHAPWPLQPAEAEFESNRMAEPLGLTLSGAPLLHFARRLDVVAWPPQRVATPV